jgi:hypothetical protein
MGVEAEAEKRAGAVAEKKAVAKSTAEGALEGTVRAEWGGLLDREDISRGLR